jgi:AcrR family transcriptional regulator
MADTKTNILLEATRLFSNQGYTVTTVREIAEAADVATGLVNHHFGSKKELLIAACRHAVAGIGERVALALKDCADDAVDDMARRVGEVSVGWAMQHPDAICLLGLVGTSEPGAFSEEEHKQLFAYELSSYFVPLAEKLEALYGQRGLMALVVSRVSLFGSLVWVCSTGPHLRAWGLTEEELERRLGRLFATTFSDSVMTLAVDDDCA